MHTDDARAATERICRFFETLTPQSLSQIEALYTAEARFKDPFNAVSGHAAIRRVFEHMFASLFLVWEFRFRFQRFDTTTEQVIHGGSHLQLAEDGRIADHRDYWDAAEELYEKLPGVGTLMRWLRRKANT